MITPAETNPSNALKTLLKQRRLPASYLQDVLPVLQKAGRHIRQIRASNPAPLLLGICGSQGSGKSTLAEFLECWLGNALNITATSCSLDDFYLTHAERESLSRDVHPLLQVRGVPGTHDLSLAQQTLDRLMAASGQVMVPRFDKATDDRVPQLDWPTVTAPVDVMILEGWCVGAMPQAEEDLTAPVNDLERDEDSDGRWRRFVNEQLAGPYQSLFAGIDWLIELRVPSFEQVYAWRREAEIRLREVHPGQGFSDHELCRFVACFERLTRHQLRARPRDGALVIDIDPEHRLTLRNPQDF